MKRPFPPLPIALAAFLVLTVAVMQGYGAEAPSMDSGLFLPYKTFETGSWPDSVAIGDVNNDNRNDAVLATSYYFDPDNDYHIHVFLQNSSGGFEPRVKYPAGNGESIGIGDLNGDGRKDVAVTTDHGIGVFLQNGSGGLEIMVEYTTQGTSKLRIADLNNDTLQDVVSLGYGNQNVEVFLQNTGGTLDPPQAYSVSAGGFNDLDVGDVNNDGLTDIVVMSGSSYAYDNFGVLLQLPQGGFGLPVYYDLGGNELTSGIAIGDVNNDDLQDVVVTFGGNKPSSKIAVFAQNALGTLDPPAIYPSYDIPEPVVIGDVDLDGRGDVIALNGGWVTMEVYLQDVGGTLLPYELYSIPYASHYNPHGLALGDLDGDGIGDVAIADYNYGLVVLYHSEAVYYVPDDFPTIQGAIDAAVDGYTIIVRPDAVNNGPYVENIDFRGKAVKVRSELGRDATTIDGNQAGSVVRFVNGEGPDSVLEGFTITNGSGTLDNQWTYGGGIHCSDHSSPTISKNDIRGNHALFGGGISCKDFSSPTIIGNEISENEGKEKGYGGGICCRNYAHPKILGNTITGNSAGYHGGGIYCSASAPPIENNILAGNSAWWGGGIFYTGGGVSPEINNTTITGNTAGSAGGGIYCWYDIFPKAMNVILWKNEAQKGKEVFLDDHISPGSTLTIGYSIVDGGKSSVHLEPGCSLNWGEGMLDVDPLFVDPAGSDFHLSQRSPCINMGKDDGAPAEDIDGEARPFMGTVDLGADEYTGEHSLEVDRFTLSESSGGVLNFTLRAGAGNGGRNYMIFGSVSGTAPGTPLPGGGMILPITWDIFTTIVADVNYPDSIIFDTFFGTLDPTGQSTALFNTNGPVPGMLGYRVSFAYPIQGPPWDFVSNPVNIYVVP